MRAIRLHPAPPPQPPYSPSNPAPPSSLHLDSNLPIPVPSEAGDLLVRLHATAVIRDELAWPETYEEEYTTPGHDFSGVVVEVYQEGKSQDQNSISNSNFTPVPTPASSTSLSGSSSPFKPGDQVFGMLHPSHPSAWSEYLLVKSSDAVAKKPSGMSWEEAAAVPLSALTAWQALFGRAGVEVPDLEGLEGLEALGLGRDGKRGDGEGKGEKETKETKEKGKKILITGATGGVGLYLIQLAHLSNNHVTALTSTPSKNSDFLLTLGADEVISPPTLSSLAQENVYDIIIDTIGGDVLKKSWTSIKPSGTLISIDSSSYDFTDRHPATLPAAARKKEEGVKAVWFIVEADRADLERVGEVVERGLLRVFVGRRFGLEGARGAYELAGRRAEERGRVVLVV
ncbi:NAD(P)-binding protein [Aulographum hederae CBS 113979]|uniref:NAD(P)-binding protein n=1 Tax=Aulographum hederae CBS 113979 TaxID=1176131 RepID=A0A6G1GPI2_9PEZI|nr:NAD(P)-binding protein [Aulographum hederae CBS 113979]